MKAIVLQQTGGVENLVNKEVPTPAIKDNEVLIRNKAISINPVDNYVRAVDEALKAYVRPAAGDSMADVLLELLGRAVVQLPLKGDQQSLPHHQDRHHGRVAREGRGHRMLARGDTSMPSRLRA